MYSLKRYKKLLLATAAALLLTGCRDKGPSAVEVARDEGIAYMEQAQYAEAVSSFEQAYTLCDDKMPQTKTDICLYKAACQFKQGDFEGVRDTCTTVLSLGENADAYYMRGVSFLKSGEAEAAKADFDCASELTPEDYGLFLNIYKQYEEVNQSAVGDTYLQKALAIPGEEMEDFYEKGCIYFYLKDYTKAQEELARPVEEKHQGAMELMGQVYLALNDTVHARSIYQQYMESFGENAQAYNGIVLCEIADGTYDAAIAAAEKGLALEGDAGKRDLLYNEIVAYEKNLDFESAKSKAAQFVEAYPDDEEGKKEYDFLSTR